MSPWQEKIAAEEARLRRKMSLKELLALASTYKMSDAEIQAQRESWARQDKDRP